MPDSLVRHGDLKPYRWNIQEIDAHALSADEVEDAFDGVYSLKKRRGGRG